MTKFQLSLARKESVALKTNRIINAKLDAKRLCGGTPRLFSYVANYSFNEFSQIDSSELNRAEVVAIDCESEMVVVGWSE